MNHHHCIDIGNKMEEEDGREYGGGFNNGLNMSGSGELKMNCDFELKVQDAGIDLKPHI